MAPNPPPVTANGDVTPSLSERLISNSAKIHKKSNALLLAKVATLFTDRQLYGQAIGCFYLVIAELEAALRQAMDSDARVGAMRGVMEPLWRTRAYEADLQFYLGPDWRRQIPVSPAIEAYTARLRELARSEPLLLLAHTFTQHLAGLSGGRIVKRMARRHMALPEDEGTAIFDFPGGVELKDGFKARLDAIGATLSEGEVQAVLDEQIRAFDFNIGIMQQFRVGLLAQLCAPIRLLPARYWAAAAAVVFALAAGLAASRLR